jgi:hypothetical protein
MGKFTGQPQNPTIWNKRKSYYINNFLPDRYATVVSYHGVARPQTANGGTVSSMEKSYEYIEQVVADSRQGLVYQICVWARC